MNRNEGIYNYDIRRRVPPEKLLEAALWFYCQNMETSEQQWITYFIRLGWQLAQPNGWRLIPLEWLREYKAIDSKEGSNGCSGQA